MYMLLEIWINLIFCKIIKYYAYYQPVFGIVNKTYNFQYYFTNNIGIL